MACRPVWTPFHARLHQLLRQRQLLPSQQSVLVAVSGGQDSVCLAQLLQDLQPKWYWRLGLAHCDHRWREDSAANAAQVRKLAAVWQMPFYLAVAETPINGEATARQWRYQSLAAIAQQHNYDVLVTGHTASDRAETLLFNLMRGSGADGLQSLPWTRYFDGDLHLVRPLLSATRAETADFCQAFELPIWHDCTNDDLTYARNRIRQELLPYLRSHFNPQTELHLAQTAELLQADVTYLETAAQDWYQRACLSAESEGDEAELGGDAIAPCPRDINQQIHREILRQAPLALQRRVIRQFLTQALPNQPNFQQIEKVVALLHAPNRSCTDPFPGGAIARVNHPWIQLG